MNLSLIGKNALVCGSSKGIGKAVALELATLGANVILVARSEGKLGAVLTELDTSKNQKHGFIIADFSDSVDLEQKVQRLVAQQPIHILINNTGGPAGGAIVDAEPQAFIQAFHNHLICNHILAKSVIDGMKTEGYGRIINIISTSVKIPLTGLGVSNTTRGAVANWAKTLANEVGQFGITVNNVLPGATETGRLDEIMNNKAKKANVSLETIASKMKSIIPLQRFAAPKEIAYAVAFLSSPSANYINGINLPVDGGRTKSL
ncbi:MAG: SDR family oxidoreductase [Saprospiraceae bacterium]